jgi:hypothetical protein
MECLLASLFFLQDNRLSRLAVSSCHGVLWKRKSGVWPFFYAVQWSIYVYARSLPELVRKGWEEGIVRQRKGNSSLSVFVY